MVLLLILRRVAHALFGFRRAFWRFINLSGTLHFFVPSSWEGVSRYIGAAPQLSRAFAGIVTGRSASPRTLRWRCNVRRSTLRNGLGSGFDSYRTLTVGSSIRKPTAARVRFASLGRSVFLDGAVGGGLLGFSARPMPMTFVLSERLTIFQPQKIRALANSAFGVVVNVVLQIKGS